MTLQILKFFYNSTKDYYNTHLVIWNEFIDNNRNMYTYETIDCNENESLCQSLNIDNNPILQKIINNKRTTYDKNFSYINLHEFAFIEDSNNLDELNSNNDTKQFNIPIEIVEDSDDESDDEPVKESSEPADESSEPVERNINKEIENAINNLNNNDINNIILIYVESCEICKQFITEWDLAKDKYSDLYKKKEFSKKMF